MPAFPYIFPNISTISEGFKGILLDAYGVFWEGNDVGLLPGSKEAMETLVSSGKTVGILSNSTQLAEKEINKLKAHGLLKGQHFHFLITSGEIAKHIFLNQTLPFKTDNKKFWIFGGAHPRFSSHTTIFEGAIYQETANLLEADFIYISIPHVEGQDQTDPEIFRDQIRQLKEYDLPMVCANPDRFAHEGKPPQPVVRQGSIAVMYEAMGGRVFYIGKPYKEAYAMAMQQFQALNIMDPAEILMVGDTPETDICGANAFGMRSALVIQTGIMADRIHRLGWDTSFQKYVMKDHPHFFINVL